MHGHSSSPCCSQSRQLCMTGRALSSMGSCFHCRLASRVQEGWAGLQPQHFKHLHVLTALVVGSGEQLVTIKDAVGTCHEAQGLHMHIHANWPSLPGHKKHRRPFFANGATANVFRPSASLSPWFNHSRESVNMLVRPAGLPMKKQLCSIDAWYTSAHKQGLCLEIDASVIRWIHL